jgi:hypothetical protein
MTGESEQRNQSRRRFLKYGLAVVMIFIIGGATYHLLSERERIPPGFLTERTTMTPLTEIRQTQSYTSSASATQRPVRVIFWGGAGTDPNDLATMKQVCEELGFVFERQDYPFVNNESSWFDEKGLRRFHIVVFPGGEPNVMYEAYSGKGINKQGWENVRRFVREGGSCWTICFTGNSHFARAQKFRAIIKVQPGVFKQYIGQGVGWTTAYYGLEPMFKGTVFGPQESNWPYPRVRFLPITMNKTHPLIKGLDLPDKVYLSTVASPSLLPDPGEQMEVLGWFPNGDAAMGIVKYGKGHLYLVPPHITQTLESVQRIYIDNWDAAQAWKEIQVWEGTGSAGMLTEEEQLQFWNEWKQIFAKEGDPDGSGPDRILAKAILRDAAERASFQFSSESAAFSGVVSRESPQIVRERLVTADAVALHVDWIAVVSFGSGSSVTRIVKSVKNVCRYHKVRPMEIELSFCRR